MMSINLLVVVTPPSFYHGCSTRKSFWDENFTGEEKFTPGDFTAVNMKTFGRHNVRKHIEIKGSDKYVTLDISLKFDSLYNMIIISSESKFNFGISGKGVYYQYGYQGQIKGKEIQKARYSIGNVSRKDL